jgi:hypothetical protein
MEAPGAAGCLAMMVTSRSRQPIGSWIDRASAYGHA